MAFTSIARTPEPFGVEGNMRVVRGTFENTGGSTGGPIVTGLNQVHEMEITHSSVPVAAASSVTTSLPSSTGTVTLVTAADVDGNWVAKGR